MRVAETTVVAGYLWFLFLYFFYFYCGDCKKRVVGVVGDLNAADAMVGPFNFVCAAGGASE
jgi:hypothetical protein